MGHGTYVCDCGNEIMRCKCPQNHHKIIVPKGCKECKEEIVEEFYNMPIPKQLVIIYEKLLKIEKQLEI
jgi:hypothetical protein